MEERGGAWKPIFMMVDPAPLLPCWRRGRGALSLAQAPLCQEKALAPLGHDRRRGGGLENLRPPLPRKIVDQGPGVRNREMFGPGETPSLEGQHLGLDGGATSILEASGLARGISATLSTENNSKSRLVNPRNMQLMRPLYRS